MTILKCSATTCMYNENELCSRGEIEVTGNQAHQADETSCGSFRERSMGGSAQNSAQERCGCEKIQIDCKAQECTYNSSCKCTAAAIDIDGPNANSSSDTKCGTFTCNC
ncbi:MAG: DUF1540 domain-containing protein [Eubacteriales bacterium]|nr:DUF1540 domain-containing protein [Eubacteriales bacterium]